MFLLNLKIRSWSHFQVGGAYQAPPGLPRYTKSPDFIGLNLTIRPLSLVGRFRLGGQVWLGIENLKPNKTTSRVLHLNPKTAISNKQAVDKSRICCSCMWHSQSSQDYPVMCNSSHYITIFHVVNLAWLFWSYKIFDPFQSCICIKETLFCSSGCFPSLLKPLDQRAGCKV